MWNSFGGEDVQPDSWDECISLLLGQGGSTTLYRGQKLHEWPLACTLERHITDMVNANVSGGVDEGESASLRDWTIILERRMLHRFQDLAEQFGILGMPAASDRLGWWEVMQHHGAPTRLLDWTRSPFIALWFAFEHHVDGDGDAALWALDERQCTRFLGTLLETVNAAPDTDFIDSRTWQNRVANAAIEKGHPTPLPVQPRREFGRATAQQSVLTVVPRVPSRAHQAIIGRVAKRIRIRERWKEEILRACQSLRYDRLTLYRDLDSIAVDVRDNMIEFQQGIVSLGKGEVNSFGDSAEAEQENIRPYVDDDNCPGNGPSLADS
jgi:hypothetical protein